MKTNRIRSEQKSKFLVCLILIFSMLLIGVTLFTSYVSIIHSHEIEIGLGKLKGIALSARNKKTYYAYYGIPYAKSPDGALRFEPPVAADSWNGTLDATKAHDVCPQISEDDKKYAGIEDCLYVDVYTPENALPGSNFPVVFYVFGGLYKYGSTIREGVSFFMGRDIIIVRPSYRLGVLGFLSTGDTVIPGNMGMKDLAMALRWTKKNIFDFGGDPHRITLHGHSSGAACVYLLTLSPLSENYYDRAVFQSGLGTSPHLFTDPITAKGITRRLAEAVNCSVQSSVQYLKDCLQNKSTEELVTTSEKLYIWKTEPQTVFRPTMEDKNVVDAFLTSHPLLMSYLSHTKPWIIGMTTGESLSYINAFDDNTPTLGEKVTFPVVGIYEWTAKLNHINFIEQLTKTHFFENGLVNNRSALVKMFNGIMHGMTLLEAVRAYKGPKFIYLFDYRGLDDETLGVDHALDLQLLFVRPNGKDLTEEDINFSEEMITRWLNFYYSGNPNQPFTINTTIFAAWEPMSSPRVEYLCIERSGMMKKDYFVNEYSWWKKVPFFSRFVHR